MRKIKRRKLISYLIFSIVNIILMLILVSNEPNINLTTYLSTLQLISALLLIRVNKQSFFSIITIFLLLSYLFHFGQAIIMAYGFNDVYAHRSVLSITSHQLYLKAMYFAMLSNYFIAMGMIWSNSSNKILISSNDNEDYMLKKLRNIALIVLGITLIPLIYLDIQKIIAVMRGGYLSIYETYVYGINKILNLIAQFARPAITMLIISYKKNQRRASVIFGLSSLYFIIMMISGDRGTNMIYLLTNIFVYFKIIKEIKARTIVLATIFGYFLIGFVSTISILRDTSQISIKGIIHYFNYRSSDGIIYSTLREFGSTLQTLIYSMQFTPEIADYNYGFTYIWSWLNLSPKLPDSIINYLSSDFTFVKSFPIAYQDSLGGSYLGEIFYNFGWFGSLMSIFIGKFIGSINDNLESSIKNKNWLVFSIFMILFPNLMLWVRGYFVELLFRVFWMGTFTLILYYTTKKKININIANHHNEN